MEESKDRLSEEQIRQFHQEGYVVLKGLFTDGEVTEIKDNFMKMHANGPIPGCFEPVSAEEANGDVLKQYPRMLHPQKVNEVAFRYMLNPKVMAVLQDLLEEEPLALQSMFYFKPPGAKGQALHQDNYYLGIRPGTCVAAWTAVDPTNEENGCIMVVPGSNREDIQCPKLADPELSFTKDLVELPEGMQPVPVLMDAGDVLFFNGSVIHGSYPNRSADRFRRAFIAHYAGISLTHANAYYTPLYRADHTPFEVDDSEISGPCGTEFDTTLEIH
ncbi:phytanoyl-CoA dioxygenase family protein [Cohnella silvisoli]|uniref:Phytanoyl-CoA dioxygenase family protein n=1 Tax=Cohnella silvisoli TaxID=2873699 RepID=A0ABV1L426_9BACL|nr:phytanoyl-CoA dioxygenase family protein [Cohnella silvisoli]MCD9026416.1 phytanoyl-CoA dioxygenase family protein [Cohnella silvisoli]